MTVYKPVPIDENGSTEPVQYVGTYVLRWPVGVAPTIGFVEATHYPDTSPLRAFLDGAMAWLLECPYCGESWHSDNHEEGRCDFNNRLQDAEDCMKRIEKYQP